MGRRHAHRRPSLGRRGPGEDQGQLAAFVRVLRAQDGHARPRAADDRPRRQTPRGQRPRPHRRQFRGALSGGKIPATTSSMGRWFFAGQPGAAPRPDRRFLHLAAHRDRRARCWPGAWTTRRSTARKSSRSAAGCCRTKYRKATSCRPSASSAASTARRCGTCRRPSSCCAMPRASSSPIELAGASPPLVFRRERAAPRHRRRPFRRSGAQSRIPTISRVFGIAPSKSTRVRLTPPGIGVCRNGPKIFQPPAEALARAILTRKEPRDGPVSRLPRVATAAAIRPCREKGTVPICSRFPHARQPLASLGPLLPASRLRSVGVGGRPCIWSDGRLRLRQL